MCFGVSLCNIQQFTCINFSCFFFVSTAIQFSIHTYSSKEKNMHAFRFFLWVLGSVFLLFFPQWSSQPLPLSINWKGFLACLWIWVMIRVKCWSVGCCTLHVWFGKWTRPISKWNCSCFNCFKSVFHYL